MGFTSQATRPCHKELAITEAQGCCKCWGAGLHQDLELALEVQDLVLCGDQVLGVEVAVAAHGLVQVLLLPQRRVAIRYLSFMHSCCQHLEYH